MEGLPGHLQCIVSTAKDKRDSLRADLGPPLVRCRTNGLSMSLLVSREMRTDVRNLSAVRETGRDWVLGDGIDRHVALENLWREKSNRETVAVLEERERRLGVCVGLKIAERCTTA